MDKINLDYSHELSNAIDKLYKLDIDKFLFKCFYTCAKVTALTTKKDLTPNKIVLFNKSQDRLSGFLKGDGVDAYAELRKEAQCEIYID